MDVKIKFLGGAGTVTGSRFLLEIDRLKIGKPSSRNIWNPLVYLQAFDI
jgi:hypothetical protein